MDQQPEPAQPGPPSPDGLESEDLAEGSRRDRRRARRAARKARRRALPLWRRAVPTWRMVLGTLLTLLLLGLAGFVTLYLIVPVPDPNTRAVAQSNVYYYADGTTELARTGTVNRQDVPIRQIPLETQHAVIAAEDRSFYRNKGVDLRGTARAAWNTATGKGTQGGSTITQQYVKNYYLTQDQTLSRKVKELFIALKVDQRQSKDEILQGYLNTSYYGRNAYGVQTAAKAYYGVDVSRLTVGQGAYLAALLQAPSAFDVKTATPANRARALARWNYVLDGMVTLGFLDAAARATTTFPEPVDPQPLTGLGGQAGYLVEIAENYLTGAEVLDAATLKAGGWRITTTFDKARQDAFVQAVKDELTAELDPAARPSTDTDVRVAGASVEPGTGRLVAAYGGPDHSKQQYNDALRQDNQVGSTFKPFDLAAGLEGGRTQDGRPITTRTVYDGSTRRPVVGGPTAYAPPNEDDVDYGSITLRYAMVKSVNAVYAQEGVDAGLAKVRDTAVKLGLPDTTPGMDPANSSMTLGTSTPSAVDLAAAYAALANHGQAYAPWAVLKLERSSGFTDLPELPAHPAREAVSRGTADAVTDVLQDVIAPDGTGARALGLGRPAAGKTGTTDSNRSAWFAGYTPELATVVGLFRENPTTHAKESLAGTAGYNRINGGAFPTQIWTAYMTGALRGTPVRQFDLQPGQGNAQPTDAASPSATTSPSPTSTPSPTPEDPTTGPSPTPVSPLSPSRLPSRTPSVTPTAPLSPSGSRSPSPTGPAVPPSRSPAASRVPDPTVSQGQVSPGQVSPGQVSRSQAAQSQPASRTQGPGQGQQAAGARRPESPSAAPGQR
ncbi:transglycosylase domain-containing protein [Kitasatospora sp. NPDC096147]|uniref:transglycosylase domain-containing protein n=1 Tax=Kitasatospora sp. NPDC096147 TaxID=3364093 RepID=UPI00382583E9